MGVLSEDSIAEERRQPEPHWRGLVDSLGLQPHPEGGYYREVFRSGIEIQTPNELSRSAGTSIYYLLAEGAYSAWHRIDADEVWYFHTGWPLVIHVLSKDGGLTSQVLGHPAPHANAVFQLSVPAGCWFSAELSDPQTYALVSCAVMPGFEFSGFQIAGEDDLLTAIHSHGEWLRRLLSCAASTDNAS